MLPLWVFLLLAVLLLTVVYLLWRLKNCKCSIYEKFETAAEADTDPKDETTDKEADVETKKADTTVVEDPDVESAPEAKKKDEKKTEDTKDKDTEKATETKPASTVEKTLNLNEMKLFDNLRENAYSLQDIKRMIREGEITEKMIEKFLARVETMENRASSGKRPEVSIEGFSGNRYASALFN